MFGRARIAPHLAQLVVGATAVSGMTVEQFGVSGSEQGSTGGAKPLSAACKHVAAIPKR